MRRTVPIPFLPALFFTLLLGAATLPVARAQAAPPDELNYQGVLRDAAGAPLDGSFDMTFRFFDAATAGEELLVDRQTAADSAPVVVTGGLFDAALGTGLVSDGVGAGTYATLSEVFAAESEVWLQVQVGAETLLPRVKISSSAYALNAGRLGGVDAGAFLRSDAVDTFTGAQLQFAEGANLWALGNPASLALGGTNLTFDVDGTVQGRVLESERSIHLNTSALAAPAQGLYFGSAAGPSTESLLWNSDRFDLSDDLRLISDVPTIVFTPPIGTGASRQLSLDGAADTFTLNGDLDIGGGGTFSSLGFRSTSGTGQIEYGNDEFRLDSDLRLVRGFEPIVIRFDTPDNFAFFEFDRAQDWFRISEQLVAPWFESLGNLYLNAQGPDANSSLFFYEDGFEQGEWLSWNNADDRFVFTDALKVEQLDSQGNLHLRIDGPDGNGSIWFWEDSNAFGERIYWRDDVDRFETSDDVAIAGDLSVFGAKNFVQNHPHDPSLSVVYTALEGDEAATFTRGTARLEGGVARVALGETFAWVTHPEIGLTAHLTPREGPAALWVESLTPSELVVRADPAAAPDARFDYVVLGLRIGYEEHPAVRDRTLHAPVPSRASTERELARRPERRTVTPLARHAAMLERAGVPVPARSASAAADALRDAIGTYDPDLPRALRAPGDDAGAVEREAVEADGATSAAAGSAETGAAADRDDRSDSGAPAGIAAVAHAARPDAAWLDATGEVAAGDVVALDPDRPGLVRRAATMADPGVVGVALDAPSGDASGAGARPVALAVAGLATVRVDAGYGAIRPGDLLVASPTPGHAMRALEALPGTVLGKAIEPLETGRGAIRVLLASR